MKAQDIIHRGDFDPCDHQAAYRLFKAAFGREDLARKAQSQAAQNYMTQEIAKHGQR